MSISLPNGSILAAPSSQPQLSAAVTRILHLFKFSPELKTRDIQNMFKEWEADKGGFRIKWVDDVNALVVFADPGVAKRAYLAILLSPPANFRAPASIRPYDRPDAAQIIQSLAARTMGHRSSMSSALTSGSISTHPYGDSHSRGMSITASNSLNGSSHLLAQMNGNGHTSHQSASGNGFKHPAPVTQSRSTNSISISQPHRLSHSNSNPNSILHNRTNSSSTSSSWGRQTVGAGALNFQMGQMGMGNGMGSGAGMGIPAPSSAGRLPTHSESSANASRSSSTSGSGDPILVMDSAIPSSSSWKSVSSLAPRGMVGFQDDQRVRRESVSADKALREVQKALASVEAQG